MHQKSHGPCQSSVEYGNTTNYPACTKSVPIFRVLKWNMIQVKVTHTHTCFKYSMVCVRVQWSMETPNVTQQAVKVSQSSECCMQWNTIQTKNSLEDLASSSSCQASPPPSSSLSAGWGGGLGMAAPILAASSDAKSPPLFGRACQIRSKHIKASRESYLLGQKNTCTFLG